MVGRGITHATSGSIFGFAPPVPDWVRTAAKTPLPVFAGKPQAVVLLDETTYAVGADGRATKHVRYVAKILQSPGREYGYPAVWFDKDSKVTSMHVWRMDPAGHEYSLKDEEIKEFSRRVRVASCMLMTRPRGRYQPHPAGDIYKGRYGNCKDKATLQTTYLPGAEIYKLSVTQDNTGFILRRHPIRYEYLCR